MACRLSRGEAGVRLPRQSMLAIPPVLASMTAISWHMAVQSAILTGGSATCLIAYASRRKYRSSRREEGHCLAFQFCRIRIQWSAIRKLDCHAEISQRPTALRPCRGPPIIRSTQNASRRQARARGAGGRRRRPHSHGSPCSQFRSDS